MSQINETAPIDKVRQWIQNRNPDHVVQMDDDLIKQRLIDSLAFTELLYVIEDSLGGIEIDFDALPDNTFRSLRSIEEVLFTRASQ
ncbi:hypothetical protein KIH74_15205 [Kineosporia sp. J2-2]|uniref:Acyl carrier protein n=1 Tax=Kineosporia corallincola TaxID=2835133 RepID=A0ABS5THE7_9ACTN|nr:hypothetical protein [Kineosporia corallincola]MBT0770288.1 hypothetical protein [Kineosporia corallincola]